MSGRLLTLVLFLAAASAAVGAGAAFLIQRSNDADQTTVAQNPAAVSVGSNVDAETASGLAQQTAASDQTAAASASPTIQQAQSEATEPRPAASTSTPAAQQSAADQARAAQQAAKEPEPVLENQQAPEEQSQALDEQDGPAAAAPSADEVSLSPGVLTQGEAFALTVTSPDALSVAATLDGRSWNLAEIGSGTWWGIVAVARDADTGSAEVVIDLYGEGGAWLRSYTSSIVVLASAAPFEEVILGGTGITADPAEVQRDHDVRFVEHVAVSGPARWHGPWILPAEGEVTGVFGSRRSYDGVPSDGWHHGHDIAADHGDPIVAPAPGRIAWTGELAIHGFGVIIDHGAGVYSGYWHMSLIAVREGVEVAAGDWLGNIGTTGLSTGPHLHWEVIIQGVDVDPVQWMGEDRPPLPTVGPEPEESADTLN